jgi:hypothetical protein
MKFLIGVPQHASYDFSALPTAGAVHMTRVRKHTAPVSQTRNNALLRLLRTVKRQGPGCRWRVHSLPGDGLRHIATLLEPSARGHSQHPHFLQSHEIVARPDGHVNGVSGSAVSASQTNSCVEGGFHLTINMYARMISMQLNSEL